MYHEIFQRPIEVGDLIFSKLTRYSGAILLVEQVIDDNLTSRQGLGYYTYSTLKCLQLSVKPKLLPGGDTDIRHSWRRYTVNSGTLVIKASLEEFLQANTPTATPAAKQFVLDPVTRIKNGTYQHRKKS